MIEHPVDPKEKARIKGVDEEFLADEIKAAFEKESVAGVTVFKNEHIGSVSALKVGRSVRELQREVIRSGGRGGGKTKAIKPARRRHQSR